MVFDLRQPRSGSFAGARFMRKPDSGELNAERRCGSIKNGMFDGASDGKPTSRHAPGPIEDDEDFETLNSNDEFRAG